MVFDRIGSSGFVYVVKEKETKSLFVIKQIPTPADFDKQRFEDVTSGWKKSLKKTENIVYYYNHWYEEKYLYILMEYCPNGDLSQLILKKIKDKMKFTEKVFIYVDSQITL
jgi:serine/threonine protein kinase